MSASEDQTLNMWDLNSGDLLMTFYAEAPLHCCAVSPDGSTIVAGDRLGHVHFLRVENAISGPPVVTPWNLDRTLAFGCPFCRVWSQIPESALGTELPCPGCGKPIKLNPFTINADWRPVAKAWTDSEK